MASIRRLPSGNFQAAVLMGANRRETKTFDNEIDAANWAAETEHERNRRREEAERVRNLRISEMPSATKDPAQAIKERIDILAVEIDSLTKDDDEEVGFGKISRMLNVGMTVARREGLIEAWEFLSGDTWGGPEIETTLQSERLIDLPEGVRDYGTGTLHRTTCGYAKNNAGGHRMRAKDARTVRLCRSCKPDMPQAIKDLKERDARS